MIYLFAASEYALIEKAIRKTVDTLIREENPFNLVRYDLREVALLDVLDEATMISFDNEPRVFILDHATFLTTSTEKTVNKDVSDQALKYLELLDESVHLLFIARSPKLNKKHKLVTYIEKNGKINIEKDRDANDWDRFATAYFERHNTSLDHDAKLEFLARVNNLGALLNEAEKLTLYGDHIDLSVVEELVTPLLEENSFALVNAFISGDKAKTLKIYQDFRVQNQEPIAFITQVGNQFRLYARIFILHESGQTNDDIATTLKVHPYRVKLAMDQRRKTSLDQVFSILLQLSELDHKIKSGQIDRFYGFELFLLNN